MTVLVKTSLGSEVTRTLRRMLIDGRFKPGERLVEDKLSGEMGISRTPLREALHRLEQEGLLMKRPKGGYSLKPLSADEVEDALGIRALLESHAAALAARRAGPDLIEELARNLEEFRAAGAAGDTARLVELNSAFHAGLRQACGSDLLTRLLAEIEGVTERIARALISLSEAGGWSGDDHQDIVLALKNRDPEAATQAMRRHVLRGGALILARMRRDGFML